MKMYVRSERPCFKSSEPFVNVFMQTITSVTDETGPVIEREVVEIYINK